MNKMKQLLKTMVSLDCHQINFKPMNFLQQESTFNFGHFSFVKTIIEKTTSILHNIKASITNLRCFLITKSFPL